MTFAQKAIATGMSVVLTFGLSPLGQVPAYAAQKDDKQPAQQAALLQTQAKSLDELLVVYGEAVGDHEVGDVIENPTYTGEPQTVAFQVWSTDGDGTYLLKEGDNFSSTLTFYETGKTPGTDKGVVIPQNKSGEEGEEVDDGTYSITGAGTYVVKITGKGEGEAPAFKGVTKELSFQVDRMDIEDAEVSPVNAAGGVITDGYGLPYTGSDEVVTAKATGASSALADEIVSSKATARAVGPYTVDVTPYGAEGNKNLTGSQTVNFQVKQNSFFAAANTVAEEAVEGEPPVAAGDVIPVAADEGEYTAYATVNGAPILVVDSDEGEGNVSGDYTPANLADTPATKASVDGEEGKVATVTVDKLSKPLEVKYGDTGLEEFTDYSVTYYYDANTAHAAKWTEVELSNLAKHVGVGDFIRADISVKNPAKFVASESDSGTYEVTAYIKVVGDAEIESLADAAVVSDATYLGGEVISVNNKDFSASFTKDGSPVSTIGKAWKVKAGDSYGIASGTTATTAKLDSKSTGPVAAGDYTVLLTGDGESFNTEGAGDGVLASFKVKPRVAKEGADVGDLKITLDDQPYNEGDFVNLGYKVEMVIDADGNTREIEDTYTAALGNEVRNWKVTWKDSQGNKVIAPTEKGDYTATFEFSGNLEGTPDITKSFKVNAGNIANYVDGLSIDAGARDTYVYHEKYDAVTPAEGDSPKDKGWYVLVEGDYVQATDITVDGETTYYEDNSYYAQTPQALKYVSSPSLTYTGKGQEVDKKGITLVKKWTKDDDATHTKNYYYKVDKTVSDNCDYVLSYTPRNETARLDADGKPLTAGVYNMTATFSGSYEGTVTGIVTVYTLDLSNVVLAGKAPTEAQQGKAIVQYRQDDGSYDAHYSAAYTGAAVTPTVRIVAVDGKEFSDNPTVIDEGAYEITFKDNTAAGSTAQIKVVPAAGQGSNVNYTTGWQEGAFKIADSSFDKIGASVSLSKSSAKYGSQVTDLTLQVKSTGAGTLSYVGKDENGRLTGSYDKDGTKTTVCYDATSKKWMDGETEVDADEVTLSESNAYSLRVIGPDGKDVNANGDVVTFNTTVDDPTTVKVVGMPTNKAGDYTFVVEAATTAKPLYGGRVTSSFAVQGMDISDANLFDVSYQTTKKDEETGAVTPVVLPRGAEWSVDYDATLAKSKYGIRLDDKVAYADSYGYVASDLVVAPAGTDVSYDSEEEGWNRYNVLTLSEDNGKTGDYTLEYENNTAAGTATVKVKGVGDYTGEVVKEFKINRAKITNAHIIYDDAVVKYSDADGRYHTPYTANYITPSYEVVLYNGAFDPTDPSQNAVGYLDASEYSAQWWKNKDVSYAPNSPRLAAAAGVLLDFTKNYEGTLDTQLFQIDPVDLYNNPNVTIDDIADLPESAEKVVPNVTVKLNGTTLVQGTDYVVNTENDGKAGTYTAYIASGKQGNTTVSTPIPVQFEIKKAEEITYDLTGAKVALSASKFTYNGQVQAPTVSKVTLANGVELTADQFKAAIPSPTKAGSYKVTVTGAAANVTGTATASFKIAKAKNTLKVKKATRTAKGVSKAKKAVAGLKVAKKGQGTVTYKKVKVSKLAKKFSVNKKTGKITVKKGTKAGTYKVTVSAKAAGNANYKASALQKAVVTVKVKK